MKPTQEQVIAWAREAGFRIDQEGEVLEGDDWHIQTDVVERFAALAYEAGRKDENEACAKVVEQAGVDGYGTIAAALLVRERGAP